MFQPNAKTTASLVEAIVDALSALSPGQTITYAELSRAMGTEVTSQSYVVQRARKKAEQQTGAIFDNVMGQGYQRLPTHEIPGVGKRANAHIRKTARNTRRRLESVRANDMSTGEIAAIAAYRSHFGMLESIAKEHTVQVLERSLDAASTYAPVKNIASRMAALMRDRK